MAQNNPMMMTTQNEPLPQVQRVVSREVIRPGPDADVKHNPDSSRCGGLDDTDFSRVNNQPGPDIQSLSTTELEANDGFELYEIRTSGSSIGITNELDFPSSWPLTPQAEDVLGAAKSESTDQPCSRTLVWENIWVPSLLIQGPMIVLLVVMTAVISSCRVKAIRGPLPEPNSSSELEQQRYLLINIQASLFTFQTAPVVMLLMCAFFRLVDIHLCL